MTYVITLFGYCIPQLFFYIQKRLVRKMKEKNGQKIVFKVFFLRIFSTFPRLINLEIIYLKIDILRGGARFLPV